MHRARLTRQAQNSHPSCRGRRPRRPVNSIKNAASGGIFTLSRGAERPNCDRPRSGHLSGRTRAPKASGRGGRGRNVGASVPAQKRFSLGLHPVSLGKTKEMGWNRQRKRKDNQQQNGEFRPAKTHPRAGMEPRPYGDWRNAGGGTSPYAPLLECKKDRDESRGPFGGGGWIRTTVGIASRFTVCPLWPLGNSPICNFVRRWSW